ncbi:MAG: hypothetical protein AAGJ82_02695 [Bacteroidota bacterium]
MLGWKLLIGGLLLLGSFLQPLVGQDIPWNNQQYRWIPTEGRFALDSLTVVPSSLELRTSDGTRVDTLAYDFSYQELVWQQSIAADSVLARYRTLPYAFSRSYTLIDTTQRQDNPEGLVIGSYNPYAPTGDLFEGQNLQYRGSFSRGLSFGNRQDLVLNSSFNLQLAGELGDDIRITAAITDENLPIQPEGNTRQLRDFDRIFIRLERDQTSLTAGDYELTSPDGYFLKYFKKLEGASLQHRQAAGKDGLWESTASVAIARGQFRRQQLNAIEGNQGPYKLQGNSGERFLIILAGTEKVFIDGQAMQRGRDADYTIDYNQGEVTFTARRLITKDSRITVEFEYADQRYLRSLYAGSTRYTQGRWQAYANVYSQQDSKTATGDLQLTEEERLRLREAGDDLNEALLSTINQLDAPDPQRSTYRLVDTLLNCNGQDTVYSFLRFDPAGTLVAGFTFLGDGQGNYVLDTEKAANERVYRWVAPDPVTCLPQGNYEPARNLVAPQLQRMLAAGGSYRVGQDGEIRAELAYSTNDLNRFSTLDAEDDEGLATRLDWRQQFALGSDSSHWRLQTKAHYEYVQATFRSINPYRSPEFLRDWSLANVNGIGTTSPEQEQLAGTGLRLQHEKLGELTYNWSSFTRGAQYQGQRHSGQLRFQYQDWRITASNSWLNSSTSEQRTVFTRPRLQIRKQFRNWNNWQLELDAQRERNAQRPLNSETLAANSFFFDRYVAGLSSPEEGKWQLQTVYRSRLDYLPDGNDFTATNLAREGELTGRWRPNAAFNASGNLTYRELQVRNAELSQQDPAQTLLGRIDATVNLWKGSLRTNTTYEIGSGQEPRVEFTYLFVGPGQGQYIWLDSLYNNDGKIQPNEMEIAPFPDIADHIRVTILNDDFIRTDNVNLNQSISIDPARIWAKSDKKWQRFLRRFDWQSSLTINRKTRDFAGVQAGNPFQLELADSALVAVSANQRHALFFNRRSAKYDIQLEYVRQPRRQVPTTGFEAREMENYTLRSRWNATEAATIRLEAALRSRSADSEFFNNKDYQLDGFSLTPAVSYQPGRDYRLALSYLYQEERNQLPGTADELQRQELELSGNYKQWLRLSASYVRLDLAGDPRSPVGFVLLNGLQPGQNWLWNASLTRQVGRYLQLTFTYEGRQTGEAQPVHVGRAQVTAVF